MSVERKVESRTRRLLRWIRRHPIRTLALVVVLAIVAFNVVAWRHARAMMSFEPGGTHTEKPERLSVAQKLHVLAFGVRMPRPENGPLSSDLASRAETFRVWTADDVTIEAVHLPADRPRGTMIFFHGYAGCRTNLVPMAKAARDLGLNAVIVDFRGSGGSAGRNTTIGFREAEDVAAVFRHMKGLAGRGPIILYGQSMGGAAVLRALATTDLRPDGVIIEAIFDRMHSTVANRFRLMGLPTSPGTEALMFWGGVQAVFDAFRHNPLDYADSCDTPSLFLHGDADANTRIEEGRAVFARISGRKTFVTFPGAGHEPLFNADPKRWKEAVESFVKTLP